MALVIINRPPLTMSALSERGRYAVKKIIGRVRGPQVVTTNLLLGLKTLGVPYAFNPPWRMLRPTDTMYVNESVAALRAAIQAKAEGRIKALWAGPALTVTPDEAGSIMTHPLIDGILEPCAWVRDFWVSLRPDLVQRLHVWPTGIPLAPLAAKKRSRWIVFHKNALPDIAQTVVAALQKNQQSFVSIFYGHYSRAEYQSLLDEACGLVYLSPSESQGFALFEAWERNVPTLVWSPGQWQYGAYSWYDAKISAPYLTDACGIFFKKNEDFAPAFQLFRARSSLFAPRAYVEEFFTLEKTTHHFIELLGMKYDQ